LLKDSKGMLPLFANTSPKTFVFIWLAFSSDLDESYLLITGISGSESPSKNFLYFESSLNFLENSGYSFFKSEINRFDEVNDNCLSF
jgi:hypothetical protein